MPRALNVEKPRMNAKSRALMMWIAAGDEKTGDEYSTDVAALGGLSSADYLDALQRQLKLMCGSSSFR
jgi:hypothetical protein